MINTLHSYQELLDEYSPVLEKKNIHFGWFSFAASFLGKGMRVYSTFGGWRPWSYGDEPIGPAGTISNPELER